MTRADLLADLRAGAFGRARPLLPRRIGAEIELIPADAVTGLMAPIHPGMGPGTLPVLRALARELGWTEQTGSDAPSFLGRDGCLISYEPGGQIEVSSPPETSVGRVVSLLEGVVEPLRDACGTAGILLREVGTDPLSPPEAVPLQLGSDRYRRMDRYLSAIGPAGPRMMRQTASLQVNVDWADDRAVHWRVLNGIAPYLTAIFANSPRYAGRDMGAKSYRALTWLEVDPRRTGLVEGGADPAAAYLDFALDAPAILAGDPAARPSSFREMLPLGAGGEARWAAHLTTLFPEIRPKGFAEVRSIDALPARWLAAPLALLVGLTDAAALRAAEEVAGAPDATLLERAGRRGLSDPRIAERAEAIFRVGLEGAEAVGMGRVETGALAVAWDYFSTFTRAGVAPADGATIAGGAGEISLPVR